MRTRLNNLLNNHYFFTSDSRILFIEIVNILKNTINKPNHPKIIANDNKLVPKSSCSKFCINPNLLDITLL